MLEPSHIGLFPLQFDTEANSNSNNFDYLSQSIPKNLSKNTRFKVKEKEKQRVEDDQLPCECRNCLLEMKYERKRRKKAEKKY